MGRPAKYPAEFRREAVALVESSGRPVAEVARSLELAEGTLWNWVKLDREATERATDPDARRRLLRQRRDGGVLGHVEEGDPPHLGPDRRVHPLGDATILFDYIEVFYDRSRHQQGLEDRTPAETYAASSAA